MNTAFITHTFGRACAVMRNVYLGLWVLFSECRWLVGEGLTRQNQIKALQMRREMLRGEVARLTVLADPRRLVVEGDLILLESDCRRLELAYEARQIKRRSALQARFPEIYSEMR